MPQYTIPPWIHGAQTAQMYAHGFPLGLEAGQAAARIHQLQAQMQLEAQKAAIEAQHQQLAITLAQQREQRESIQKQQELEVQKSYHDQVAQLREQDIAQKEQKLQQAAAITAHKYQAQAMMQRRAQELIAQGKSPAEAYMQANIENPESSGSAVASLGRAMATPGEKNPHVQTVTINGKPTEILVGSGGKYWVPPNPNRSIEDAKSLTDMIDKAKAQKASPDVIAALENNRRKALGLPEESPKAAGPNPIKSGIDWIKSKFGGGATPDSATGDIPDWAALPGEDQAPASLSDIASRMKAGPASAEADIPDYAKLPGEDLTGPIPLPNTEKELSADETYINPKGPGLLQWNPDTKKLSVIEQPQQEEPPPETETDAPLPGEE